MKNFSFKYTKDFLVNLIKMGCIWIMEYEKKSFNIFGVTEDHRFEKEEKRNSNALLLLFTRGTVHFRSMVCRKWYCSTVFVAPYSAHHVRVSNTVL